MHYSRALCTPSDPNLMNARWQHLIILDPRTRIRTLAYYSLARYRPPLPPRLCSSHKERARRTPVDSSNTRSHGPNSPAQHVGDGGSCPPLSFIYHLLQKISSHDQQHSSPNPVHLSANWLLVLPDSEFPVTIGQPFSFISPLHRQRAGPLPWRAFIYPICILPNSKRVLIRSPARNFPA